MPSTRTGIADYEVPSHVANEVIVTIADWIAANVPKTKPAAPAENVPPATAPPTTPPPATVPKLLSLSR